MVYICNMKSSGKNIGKDGKKVNLLYIVDQNHQRSVIVIDHSRNFTDGGCNGEIFIQEEEIIVRN